MIHRIRTILVAILVIAGSSAAPAAVSAAGFEDALLDGELNLVKTSGEVFIAVEKGSVFLLTDPLDGGEIGEAPKKELTRVKVNNRMRGAIRGALGALTLLNPDPDTRVAAADAVFKDRSAEMALLLEKALAREVDETVKGRMERALASVTALAAALQADKLMGTAIDAYVEEPPDRNHPIFSHPRVVFTPHCGADTTESVERMGLMNIADIDAVLAGEHSPRVLNPQIYDGSR